ncbi:KAP family P-loop NTPase fold protein [Prosthecobacter fusiformis]|uniref:KAP family P-loop NTPase fold protein n=1 Tax=Prosthecobacter fusiformis TaxID=48464 RepID=UPI001415313D|nr:P-loop NTPase fold protein [Prosthecobacter fusiformis]
MRLWQWNQRRKSLPTITAVTILILFARAQTPHATASAILCWIVLWYLLFLQLKTPPFKEKETPDSYQRSYFVDRIMELFGRADTKLRRIAVMGTWGSGKTTVLQLLRERLAKAKEKKFRVAWVNPWTAKTPEEARALIAQGFEDALGNTFSQLTSPGAAPWSWFSSLKASLGFGLSVDVSRLIEGEAKATESAFIARINQRLEDRNITVVLLVDDMERAEPEVIRRIFPVIDRLGAIKHCFFVFAIDPDRVAKAFNEESRNAEETKGYLDKVFDLQIQLPALRPQDIEVLGKALIRREDTPKLHAAWDHLKDLLPTNPREALHFIHDAITKETLFLSRYADDEHNYLGFFLFRMLDLEEPEFTNKPIHILYNNYAEAQTDKEYSGQSYDGIEPHKMVYEFWEKLKVPPFSSLKLERLTSLLTGFFENHVEISWARDHHMRLLTPSEPERKMLHEYWKEHHGQESLETSINKAIPHRSFSDKKRAASELIDLEISHYEDLRRNVAWKNGPARIKKISAATDSVQRLCSQLQFGYVNKSDFDIQCFPSKAFETWLDLLCRHKLSNIPGTENLICLEYRFHTLLSDRLALRRRFGYSKSTIEEMAYASAYDGSGDQHLDHFARLKEHMLLKVRDDLILRIEQGTLDSPSLTHELKCNSLDEIFGDPSCWLPEGEINTLNTFSTKAPLSPVFAKSVADITEYILLALQDSLSETQPGPAEKKITDQIKATPDYFAYFWHAAQFATDQLDDLKDLRHRVEQARSQSPAPLLTAEELNAAFPMITPEAAPE